MAAPLPLAAGINGLEGLLTLLFILFWVVAQVRNLFRNAGDGRPAGPGAPRPRAADDLARQIDEFIRKAAAEGVEPPVAPRRDSAAMERKRGPTGPARRPGAAPPLPGGRRPVRSDARTPRPGAPPRIAPVSAPQALGSLGGHAADVARHVDDAFAHEIAHLPAGGVGQAAVVTAPAAPVAAAGIAALLRDPATLRQLVIVREVLDRPVERW